MCACDGMDGCPGVRGYIHVDVFALVACGCGGAVGACDAAACLRGWRSMRCGAGVLFVLSDLSAVDSMETYNIRR
jgi:hypothetical protein